MVWNGWPELEKLAKGNCWGALSGQGCCRPPTTVYRCSAPAHVGPTTIQPLSAAGRTGSYSGPHLLFLPIDSCHLITTTGGAHASTAIVLAPSTTSPTTATAALPDEQQQRQQQLQNQSLFAPSQPVTAQPNGFGCVLLSPLLPNLMRSTPGQVIHSRLRLLYPHSTPPPDLPRNKAGARHSTSQEHTRRTLPPASPPCLPPLCPRKIRTRTGRRKSWARTRRIWLHCSPIVMMGTMRLGISVLSGAGSFSFFLGVGQD